MGIGSFQGKIYKINYVSPWKLKHPSPKIINDREGDGHNTIVQH